MVDFQRKTVNLRERSYIERVKVTIFLDGALAIEAM